MVVRWILENSTGPVLKEYPSLAVGNIGGPWRLLGNGLTILTIILLTIGSLALLKRFYTWIVEGEPWFGN